jgi:hypothetical protein
MDAGTTSSCEDLEAREKQSKVAIVFRLGQDRDQPRDASSSRVVPEKTQHWQGSKVQEKRWRICGSVSSGLPFITVVVITSPNGPVD